MSLSDANVRSLSQAARAQDVRARQDLVAPDCALGAALDAAGTSLVRQLALAAELDALESLSRL